MIKSLKMSWDKLKSPSLPDDDSRLREIALNLLLLFSIGAFGLLNAIRIKDVILNPSDRGLPLAATLIILLFFIFLLWLSKKGRSKLAAWLLILTYSIPTIYCFITWGTDLPAALLLAILIIALSGILINANLILVNTVALSLFLIALTYFQSRGIVGVNRFWVQERYDISDSIAHSVLFLLIASIVWLFCLEIGKTLKRARNSEADLKKERDSLEIKVLRRTEQLHRAEEEKIEQLYRLAEFGRLSSGIFHDLLNPLTAISLNLEQIHEGMTHQVTSARSYLDQALLAAHKMEGLISGIKKQIQKDSEVSTFVANEEIRQIIQILDYKARRAGTTIVFRAEEEIKLHGDPIKFGQVISNLLANAIEAIEGESDGQTAAEKEIALCLRTEGTRAIITIKDNGSGIAPENLPRIFEPFFSTKRENGRGLGLGLASTKNIIEKNFNGTISVESRLGEGALFILDLPLPI